MQYTINYPSPLGGITLAGCGDCLTGLWFDGQKHYAGTLAAEHEEGILPVLARTTEWLDCYFSGKNPGFTPPLYLNGTSFRLEVWEILQKIPFGETVTYKDIAGELARRKGLRGMSAQAVGGAVAHNPISIIIPCHRVVGCNGSLTGYAGGLAKKIGLLALEGVDASGLFAPARGTAL